MHSTQTVSLSSPDISDSEISLVCDVLRSGCLSIGPVVKQFEESVSSFCNVNYGVAVNSGTSGLHLAVKSLGIGSGDEIITTPFSFIASSNCALYENALPVFVDICKETWNVDCSQIEAAITSKTKAILPVHIFGVCCEMDEINRIASKYGLHVIEDSCEALGSKYKGEMAGSLGDVGVFGFYPNKQITTGEGGMIVTNNSDVATLCQSFRNQGRGNTAWLSHEHVGYNYRMSEVQAAIGVGQMKRAYDLIIRRNLIVDRYRSRLSSVNKLELQKVPFSCEPSWFAFVVKLCCGYSVKDRDQIIDNLRSKGIGCNNYFPPLHIQKCYSNINKRRELPVCENISSKTIALPLHSKMVIDDVDYVCEILENLL